MKRHTLDFVALVWGLLFSGTAVVLLADHHLWGARPAKLVGPLAIVALGLALLASGAARHRQGGTDEAGQPQPPPGDHPQG